MANPTDPISSTSRKRNRMLAVIVPFAVYLSFVGLAFAIGSKYSCADGWLNWVIYFWYGVASLLMLFAVQLSLNTGMHLLWRISLGLVAVAVGVGIWIWAFDAGGLYLMCRLF